MITTTTNLQVMEPLDLATLPRRSIQPSTLDKVQVLQLEAYQQRLSLQPNGSDALERFELCRNRDDHRLFQQAMSLRLWEDWRMMGKDTVKCLHHFGSELQNMEIQPFSAEALTKGYAHGFIVSRDPDRPAVFGLDPNLVTALDQLHRQRWESERLRLGIQEDSLSRRSIELIDPTATLNNHKARITERVPLLSNCDRIGVMLQCKALARLDDSSYSQLLSDALPGNPFALPLRVFEAPIDYSPVTSTIRAAKLVQRSIDEANSRSRFTEAMLTSVK